MAGASSATQRTFFLQGPGNGYIDLAGMLSAQNKRLYRQGMVYHARISVTNTSPAGFANNVEVLHNSWRIRKAWSVAKFAWDASNEDERLIGTKRSRWNDFKIFYEAAHNAGNTVGPTTASDGEWNYTVSNASTSASQWQFHMLGPGSSGSPGRFGILREYDDMQDQVQDTPAGAATQVPYSALHENLSNNQADLIQEEGDLPPYSAADLERGTAVTEYPLTSPLSLPGGAVSTTGMIEIPCGLVKLATDAGAFLRIDFKAGSYKGVHAEVMA
jgi:hypothetical protein